MAPIYHLAPLERWQTWPEGEAYLPAEYEAEGFIHCTRGDELMLQVANRYYRTSPRDFVLLIIETDMLTSPLKWEQSNDSLAPLFPHIYGPINRDAIVGVREALRDTSGDFIGFA